MLTRIGDMQDGDLFAAYGEICQIIVVQEPELEYGAVARVKVEEGVLTLSHERVFFKIVMTDLPIEVGCTVYFLGNLYSVLMINKSDPEYTEATLSDGSYVDILNLKRIQL